VGVGPVRLSLDPPVGWFVVADRGQLDAPVSG